jgi:hypothetical protein
MNWSGARRRIEQCITALVHSRLSQEKNDGVRTDKEKPVCTLSIGEA